MSYYGIGIDHVIPVLWVKLAPSNKLHTHSVT